MAVKNQDILFRFNAETGDIEKVTSGLVKDMEKVADAADDAAEATEDIGKNAKKSGGLLQKAGQMGSAAFKMVGTAIAATGLLGLVTKVLQPIIAAFLENKKVADTLKVAMAALGAVINSIIDLASPLVDILVRAFTEPQVVIEELKAKLTDLFGSPKEALLNFAELLKQNIINRFEGLFELIPKLTKAIGLLFEGEFKEAGKVAADAVGKVALGVENVTDKVADAAESFGEFVAETTEAVKAATALEAQLQKLSDRERDLAVLTAQSSAEVEELKRQRDDERLSIEERIAAAEAAAAIDQRLADENVAIAEERARLLAREIELQGETEERLQALADAQIAAAGARAASAKVQTELMTSLYGLNQALIEQGRQQLEQLQETRDALNEGKAQAKEIENERLTQERGLMTSQQRQTEFIESESQKRRRIRQEEFEVFKEFVLKDQETMLNAGKYTLDMLSQLNESFTGDSEEQQRKGFERSKKIQAAQALISTFEATISAYNSALKVPAVGLVLAPIAAAATAAIGLKNVQNIKNQQFQGGGTQPDSGGGGSLPSVGGPQGPGAPALDLGFLGGGAGQSGPIQAYVLAENVSNAQQANQKIQDQATL
jgi:hypothetical protein